MRITLRLIVALVVTVAVVAALFSAYFHVHQERSRLNDEMSALPPVGGELAGIRAARHSNGPSTEPSTVGREVWQSRGTRRGHGRLRRKGKRLAMTEKRPLCRIGSDASNTGVDASTLKRLGSKRMHVYVLPLDGNDGVARRTGGFSRRYLYRVPTRPNLADRVFPRVGPNGISIRYWWSIMGPIARMAEWMKQLRAGEASAPTFTLPKEDLFAPIAKEVTTFARHLSDAKAAAGGRRAFAESAESRGARGAAQGARESQVAGRPLFVVSNREPYMHTRKGRKVERTAPGAGRTR